VTATAIRLQIESGGSYRIDLEAYEVKLMRSGVVVEY